MVTYLTVHLVIILNVVIVVFVLIRRKTKHTTLLEQF
jgi:hypothetical protein